VVQGKKEKGGKRREGGKERERERERERESDGVREGVVDVSCVSVRSRSLSRSPSFSLVLAFIESSPARVRAKGAPREHLEDTPGR